MREIYCYDGHGQEEAADKDYWRKQAEEQKNRADVWSRRHIEACDARIAAEKAAAELERRNRDLAHDCLIAREALAKVCRTCRIDKHYATCEGNCPTDDEAHCIYWRALTGQVTGLAGERGEL